MKKLWRIHQPNQGLCREISQALDVSAVLAQILINRGVQAVKEAEDFLSSSLSDLHDPFLLKGMQKSIQRIQKAIAKGEKIMVWGDYDIDGITAAALLISLLKEMGAEVCHYLPNRLQEGYGLNEKGARLAKRKGVKLLITVDCGISGNQPVSYLKREGIDTIVTDHHQPKDGSAPAAFSIINPLQRGCAYPYKSLAGVGLAFKLACALFGEPSDILERYLDLVALGTVGDIVPVTGENRILVKHGLVKLTQTKRLGLKSLIQAAGLAGRRIDSGHIGYILGPRINASGRLGSPEDSLRLLLTEEEEQADDLARKLNAGNRLRQKIESQTLQEAIEQVESQINFKDHNVIVLGAAHWHQGVIGIVASRLVERYLRPTIMMTLGKDFGRGSGRSFGNFHLLEAVARCAQFLEEYGGHRQACGIKLKRDNFSAFFQAINSAAQEMAIQKELTPVLDIDAQIPLADLNETFVEQLELLSPFGVKNPRPVICSRGLKVRAKTAVFAHKHIKFWVTDGELTYEAVGYNQAGSFSLLAAGQSIDLAYTPVLNNWQGNSSIQLKIEDLQLKTN